jgi:hypothetical protein
LATRLLLAVWCLISTLELMANFRMFRNDGLLSWNILSLRVGFLGQSRFAGWLFSERSMAVTLWIRLCAAVTLGLARNLLVIDSVLVLILATYWLLAARTWLGADGSDQMGQIVSLGALLVSIGLSSEKMEVAFAGTLLIGGQALISYFVSGAAKLVSPIWRHGIAMVGIMNTHSHGNAVAGKISQSTLFARTMCWVVMGAEVLFPLVLFAPRGVLVASLAAMLALHLSIAYFMGLNTFVWSFVATYPSVILLHDLIA